MNDPTGLQDYRSYDEPDKTYWCASCSGTQATHVIKALNNCLHLCEFHYIQTCNNTLYKSTLPYYVCSDCKYLLWCEDTYGRKGRCIIKCYDSAVCMNCWNKRSKGGGEQLLWAYREKQIMHGLGYIVGRYVGLFM